MIAAFYVVLTILAATMNLASGMIQVRFSEALTVLPYFTPAAVPGLAVGCLVSNILTGCVTADVFFGTTATLLGALGTHALRKHRFLCSWPPVISNMLIIPFVLRYAYNIPGSIPFFMLTVGAGEVLSCVVLGQLLISALQRVRGAIFPAEEE